MHSNVSLCPAQLYLLCGEGTAELEYTVAIYKYIKLNTRSSSQGTIRKVGISTGVCTDHRREAKRRPSCCNTCSLSSMKTTSDISLLTGTPLFCLPCSETSAPGVGRSGITVFPVRLAGKATAKARLSV